MNRFSSVRISNSLRACVALALLLVGSAPAHAQTVAADRIRLNAGPCTIDSVNGSPDQVRLSDCSTITTGSATNLTLQPTGDLVLSPTGVDVLPNTGYTKNLGSLTTKFLTLHAAELWVETLVAQNTIATALKNAIAAGVLEVQHGETKTTYRSLREMQSILAMMEGEVNGRTTRTVAKFSSGV